MSTPPMQCCDAAGFALPAGAQGTFIPTPPTQLLAALFAGPVAAELGAAQGTLTPAPPTQLFDGGIGAGRVAGRVGSGAASATEIAARPAADAATNARRFK